MIEIILQVFLGIYCAEVLLVLLGNVLNIRKRRPSEAEHETLVSVVLAARNEETNVANCIEALLGQRHQNIEIVAVDDRSTDSTGGILEALASENQKLRIVHIKENHSGLTGKQNALHEGVKASEGKMVLFTDADCLPDPNWAGMMINGLLRGNDLVFGITRVWPANRMFAKFQALELGALFVVAGGVAGLKLPGSCMGNNIGFLREAYDFVGGFPAIGYQPTEDFALLKAFKQRGLRIDIESNIHTVYTKPLHNLKEWGQQHIRWLKGSLSFKGLLVWSLLPVAIANLVVPAWMIAQRETLLLQYLFTIKVALDLILVLWRIRLTLLPAVIPVLIYYYVSPIIYLPLLFLKKKTQWKDDEIRL